VSADTEQRKLAAIMFTDMVGYSALSQRDSKLAVELLEEHRALLREIFPRFNGAEIKTIGDAFLVEFNSALEAAQCAIEIQRTLAKRDADAPAQRQIQLRIGIHIGDVIHREGDVYGDGVNIASRIEPLADAGGICVSMDVERQIRNAVETRFEKLAPTELKNISVAMDLFRIVLPWEKQPEVRGQKSEIRKNSGVPKRNAALVGAFLLLLIIGIGWWWTTLPHKKLASTAPEGSQPQNIPEKSIAVLPFENLSKEEENAFFAGGVQDEILSNLAKIADLKVISRTSVMKYKTGPERNLREIAKVLGVAHIVEGSVQRAVNRVRVSAQLIDARSDTHVWAEHYDRDVADVFAIQSEIAQQIAAQLRAKLSPQEKATLASRPTQDTEAYDLYLRAKELVHGTSILDKGPGEISSAVNLLEKAVARDPKFASAYCLLVEANLNLYWGQSMPGARERAEVALQAARRLAPEAAETHLVEGLFFYWGKRDYDHALESLEKAARVSPNNADVFRFSARVERRLGRWAEAIRHQFRAIELDPRDWQPRNEAISSYVAIRDYATAERMADRAIADFPERADFFRTVKAEAAFSAGDLKTARAALNTLSVPDSVWQLWGVAILEHNYKEAERLLSVWTQHYPADETLFPASFLEGLTARATGQSEKARSAFGAARQHFSGLLREPNEQPMVLSHLAIADAALGRKEEALQEGRRAVELMPISRDPLFGADLIRNLALIYSWIGERDRAIEQLSSVASLPGGPSYGELKFDPSWDELRGDPRFEKIIASLAPKD